MTPSRQPSLDRTRPPSPGAPADWKFPRFQVHALDNGLRVYLAHYPRAPMAYQLLVLPGGGQQDPLDRAGLATLTAGLLDEGTDLRPALAIAEEVEALGGYLSSQADWDHMSASLGSLAEHAPRGLSLIAEIVQHASFPDFEVERLRQQHLAELQRRRAQPASQATDALLQLLYDQTIYASTVLGTPDSLTAIRRDEILNTAHREVSPAGAALILVGDLDLETTVELARETLGGWQGGSRLAPAPVDPAALDGFRISVIDRPKAPQTELCMGSVGVPMDHPDRAGLAVLNSLLGGKFTSRLNLNLRERLGITYGVSTTFARRRGPFLVSASIDTEAVGTAVREILTEIRRLQDDLVTREELADTQSYLLGIFPYTLQRIEGLAARLADLAVYDLPHDHFPEYLRAIASVTREDLQKLAQRHLHPDAMGLVAVGPCHQLEPQLGPFGTPEIHPSRSPDSAPLPGR